MSRRMVIRCDECGTDADMRMPEWTAQTSTMMPRTPGLFGPDLKPRPPDGWFERYVGMAGILDLCSAACVQAWDERHPVSKDAFA